MSEASQSKTVPELFVNLTKKYEDIPTKYIMQQKVDGKYAGITYKQLKH